MRNVDSGIEVRNWPIIVIWGFWKSLWFFFVLGMVLECAWMVLVEGSLLISDKDTDKGGSLVYGMTSSKTSTCY